MHSRKKRSMALRVFPHLFDLHRLLLCHTRQWCQLHRSERWWLYSTGQATQNETVEIRVWSNKRIMRPKNERDQNGRHENNRYEQLIAWRNVIFLLRFPTPPSLSSNDHVLYFYTLTWSNTYNNSATADRTENSYHYTSQQPNRKIGRFSERW